MRRRKAAGEALTGPLTSGVPTMFRESEGHIMGDEQREPTMNPAQ